MKRIGFLLLFAALAGAQEEKEEEAAKGGLDALGSLGWDAKPIDFRKVDRTIKKLPELKSEKPLYGLFLFGVNGETRVWAVLDASAKGATSYDILYLDRNADGDLTGADERFVGTDGKFEVGAFKEPGTDVVHKAFTITWTKESIRYEMKWAGGPVTMGCYGPKGDTYANFAPSPKDAPVFVPGMERPFEFEHWMSGTLKRDDVTDFKVFMGNRGDRSGAFSCVDDKFLPAGEHVLAQLIYRDGAGKEQRLVCELAERC